MRIEWLCAVGVIFVTSACQQPTPSKQEPVPPPLSQPTKAEPAAAPNSARFESPRAVYKHYAEALNASHWADAISVFSEKGKTGLVLGNFKALALLAGKQHPKQEPYKAVLHDFCQAHGLRCADPNWAGQFARTLLAEGNVTELLSDVSALAASKPEATYVEVMKLLQGVDANAVVPLDPTLSHVIYLKSSATGVASRGDGQSSTMTFEIAADGGWLITE